MNRSVETDPVLALVDDVLGDLAVRSATFIGRRVQDGDRSTFVLQFGEGGRFRLALPDLERRDSIEQLGRAAQVHLERELGVPVPRCPVHPHALVLRAQASTVTWACPDAQWSCELGDYEERIWPPLDGPNLASLVAKRLHRREIGGVSSIAVREGKDGPIASFGLTEVTPDLVQRLDDAAAPLPIEVHYEPRRFIRV
jgi:hypothetical protein